MEVGGPNLYESLQRFDWYYMAHKPEFRTALPHLGDAESVLEIGAGTGAFANYVGDRRYVGLELNEHAVAVARQAGIELLEEAVQPHANRGLRYDAVVAFQVLEHVEDPRAFLQSCLRCLTPSGRLIVAVPTIEGFVGSAVNVLLNMPPHHVSHWFDQTFESIAELLGIRLLALEHEPIAEFHKPWARAVLMEQRLRRLLRLRPQLLDTRSRALMVARIANLLSRLDRTSLDGVAGHSVIAVFENSQSRAIDAPQ